MNFPKPGKHGLEPRDACMHEEEFSQNVTRNVAWGGVYGDGPVAH